MEGVPWRRANPRRYKSRDTAQRAADWLNTNPGELLWHEAVPALDGDHYELWCAPRMLAWDEPRDEDAWAG